VGLILDSSLIIGAERQAQPVSELLRDIRATNGSVEVRISAISVIELCHGIWRADTSERREARRLYLEEVFAAIAVQPFTKEMGEMAARIDAESRKSRTVIPLADLQIGVTALHLGYEVVTHNARHFEMIPGLVVKRFGS
jgi:tRNA(fMet)-specific endonuclease VapC